MKILSWAVLGLLLALPCAAENNIKMVTYFPVPYAAYGDLAVNGSCDVGLVGSCNLDVGQGLVVRKESADGRALNTGSVIVRGGGMDLNSSKSGSYVEGRKLEVGSGLSSGVVEFAHDLAVKNISGSRMQSAQAQNEAYMNKLKIFGHEFPVCDGNNHEINWRNLTVRGNSGVFLVCGNGGELPRTPCASTCPVGYMRNEKVQYQEDGECCVKEPTVYYFRCTGQVPGCGVNKYGSFNEALQACESGADPGASWCESLSFRSPQLYQRCGTPENEAYVQSKTAYWYQTLQLLDKPIDPGQINIPRFMQYSCTTSCADCGGGIGKFNPCSCTYGVG